MLRITAPLLVLLIVGCSASESDRDMIAISDSTEVDPIADSLNSAAVLLLG